MVSSIVLRESFSHSSNTLHQLEIVDCFVRNFFKDKVIQRSTAFARIEINKLETAIRSIEFELLMQGYFNSSSVVTAKFLCIKEFFYQKKIEVLWKNDSSGLKEFSPISIFAGIIVGIVSFILLKKIV